MQDIQPIGQVSLLAKLAKEFWLPLLIAASWTTMAFWSASTTSLTTLIGNFSGAFFFVSWLTGQYFRVEKQVRMEQGLVTLETRLEKLTDQLGNSVAKLEATLTGGESFCYAYFSNTFFGGPFAQLAVHTEGNDPLYDVTMTMVDLDAFDKWKDSGCQGDDSQFETVFDVGSFGAAMLGSGRFSNLGPYELGDGASRKFNIFWSARNGSYTQRLRLKRVDGIWRQASRVKFGDKVLEQIDDCFYEPDGSIKWD